MVWERVVSRAEAARHRSNRALKGTGRTMLRSNSMLTAVVCAAAVAGARASAALAGEVKGAPTEQNPTPNFNTAATSHANSVCVFSGLNDNPGSTDPNNPGGHVQ